MRVDVRIDELLLDGFTGTGAPRVSAAAERELVRLVAAGGLPHRLRGHAAIARADGIASELPADASGDMIGSAIARAIYGGLAT